MLPGLGGMEDPRVFHTHSPKSRGSMTSETQKRDLDLLEMWFLENFTLWIYRMHIRAPERVEEFRLCPNALHENLEGMEHLEDWAHKTNAW